MKSIPIYGGLFASVDDEDFYRLSKIKWHLSRRKINFYYVTGWKINDKGERVKVYLHREIMDAKKGEIIDHKDGNVLNNEKSNLRFCTQSQNMMNRKRCDSYKIEFKGINKLRDKWAARIKVNKKHIHLGMYNDPRLAAIAYNNAAIKYHGEFALLNSLEAIHGIPTGGSKI